MRIQATTGYALKILQYICEADGRTVKAGEMAEKLGISRLYMMKLLGIMKSIGLVKSIQGCNGGYRLAKAAEKITVFEVYAAIEGDFHLYSPQENIRSSDHEASIKQYFDTVEDMITLSMRRTTIQDLSGKPVKGKRPAKQKLKQIVE